jgi:poly-gamma-glutamate system protein
MALAVVAAALIVLSSRLPLAASPDLPPAVAQAGRDAAETMRQAYRVIRAAKAAAGVRVDSAVDPNQTGVIGEELTPLTSTVGDLEAKRTATDPRWASVLVAQMWLAGVRPGDVVAASFSGSFPGLNMAVISAAQALQVDLVSISSVTASMYGANQQGFTWPELEARLVKEGVFTSGSTAISPGGEADSGESIDPEGRRQALGILRQVAGETGAEIVRSRNLAEAIRHRMDIYVRAAGVRPIALYINVGGAEASLGASEVAFRLQSGLLRRFPMDRSPQRGVMSRMSERGVPVLHLLNIKGLAAKWGVPIDAAFDAGGGRM